jgi:hypothetical protein
MNEPGTHTCSVCGSRNDPEADKEHWDCPTCGSRNDGPGGTCAACGANSSDPPPASSSSLPDDPPPSPDPEGDDQRARDRRAAAEGRHADRMDRQAHGEQLTQDDFDDEADYQANYANSPAPDEQTLVRGSEPPPPPPPGT